MSNEKFDKDEPEKTLVTLDQLSQTIEVMTSVVNRLRRHLSDQIKAQIEAQEALENATEEVEAQKAETSSSKSKRESFVIEISQEEADIQGSNGKTLH
ncbi:MAG: hypothetical protein HOF74_07065 [Gammaproteobacteria bacterium]|jgi:uncharacterized protein with von Willebrand factor type A (vWA) domain|nr:hypothetical protein [Gammaproteobacteria bacterium]MBT3859572.1 hypothetical protein [Gammaproteobacteria bacterium]MBT3986534.1 hypothetical protein [Gammaproteobacteria bacterium]MBT4254635.1 hypothetical protein [Gammaproteobacteria bacterium]MBT4581122.1 hypothetical protein [Gammaproteobacteria bacterium]